MWTTENDPGVTRAHKSLAVKKGIALTVLVFLKAHLHFKVNSQFKQSTSRKPFFRATGPAQRVHHRAEATQNENHFIVLLTPAVSGVLLGDDVIRYLGSDGCSLTDFLLPDGACWSLLKHLNGDET